MTNPTVFQKSDGNWSMIYKAVSLGDMPFGGVVLHGLAEAAKPDGPYRRLPGLHPFRAQESQFAAEDPFAWWDHGSGLYRAIVKDMDGSLTGLGRSLAFYLSRDGREWVPAPLPSISGSDILWDDDTQEKFIRIERPQITFDASGKALALQLACLPEGPGSVSFSLSIPIPVGFFDPKSAPQASRCADDLNPLS